MCGPGVSPLVFLRVGGFMTRHTALKAATFKVKKHEKLCMKNQYVFIQFTLDTFGFLAPDAVKLLNRVQRIIHSNVISPRVMDVVLKRIGFTIQKCLATQLVVCFPSHSLYGDN